MKMRKIILVSFICLSIYGCSMAYKTLTVQTPDLSQLNNGVYRGSYELTDTPVKVTLDVFVQDQRISKIELINHTSSPIGNKAENIIEKVIEKQSLEIDVIGGATASSKTILKAIENALR
ncbi:MAG: FMN-binding protein [Treponema sp.]|nr:FMN-binding protein [Treponema sp.]